jgi:hypothetical protein
MMARKQKGKMRGKGSQLDAMKRVRKEMPPPTKVIKPKTKRPSNNWRDLLDDDDDEMDYDGGNI